MFDFQSKRVNSRKQNSKAFKKTSVSKETFLKKLFQNLHFSPSLISHFNQIHLPISNEHNDSMTAEEEFFLIIFFVIYNQVLIHSLPLINKLFSSILSLF